MYVVALAVGTTRVLIVIADVRENTRQDSDAPAHLLDMRTAKVVGN